MITRHFLIPHHLRHLHKDRIRYKDHFLATGHTGEKRQSQDLNPCPQFSFLCCVLADPRPTWMKNGGWTLAVLTRGGIPCARKHLSTCPCPVGLCLFPCVFIQTSFSHPTATTTPSLYLGLLMPLPHSSRPHWDPFPDGLLASCPPS